MADWIRFDGGAPPLMPLTSAEIMDMYSRPAPAPRPEIRARQQVNYPLHITPVVPPPSGSGYRTVMALTAFGYESMTVSNNFGALPFPWREPDAKGK